METWRLGGESMVANTWNKSSRGNDQCDGPGWEGVWGI